ncbi:MAG: hypothetical protein Q4D04_10930 [Clostridia bacterium]|nr:hypothetical protein [Clostridia bacterium]
MVKRGGWRIYVIGFAVAVSLLLGGNAAYAKVGRTYYCIGNSVKVHPRPNATSEFSTKVRLFKNNRVRHISSKGGWWRVRILTNKYKRNVYKVGYVDARYLRPR